MGCYITKNKEDDFARRLSELRCDRGLLQKDLALALGKSRQTITAWESRTMRPTFDDIPLIASFFGVTIDYLLTGVSTENVDIHNATGLSNEAVSSLRQLREEKPEAGGILSKALSSKDFLESVISILDIESLDHGYYDGCSHSPGEPFYNCTLSPDSYAAYLSARLTLVLNAIRTGQDTALQNYPPAVQKEAAVLDELRDKNRLINQRP